MMNHKKERESGWLWLLGVLLIWCAGAAWLLWTHRNGIAALALRDTDDNMRLQQVRDWLSGQPWFDLRQHRLDPPFGANIHWSRLVDLPLAGLIVIGRLFTATPGAERFATAVAPLLPMAVAMVAVSAMARRLVSPQAWPLPPALLLCAPMTVAMMSPLRIDHHGWQIALLLVMLLGVLTRRQVAGGLLAGVALGLSLAIGIELLPYLAFTATMVTLLWAADRTEAPRLAAFGAAAAGATSFSLIVFVPPPVRMVAYCDALSIAHVQAIALGGAGALLLAMLPVRNGWVRLGAVLALGGAVILFTWLRHPQCVGDPSALINPEARRLWLVNVREARPIFKQSMIVQVSTLALPVAAMFGLGFGLWQSRGDVAQLRRWIAIGLVQTFGLGFCFFQTRAAPAAQALAVPGATMLLWGLIGLAMRSRFMLARVGLATGVFLLISGLGPAWLARKLPQARQSVQTRRVNIANWRCATISAMRPLNTIPPATMFTFLDLSPRLIVLTHHSAIAGPYHRNGRAIADVMKMWGGTPEQAHPIVLKYHAQYLLLCPGTAEATIYAKRAPEDGMYSLLVAGRQPDWLQPVPLPSSTPYRLFRVTG